MADQLATKILPTHTPALRRQAVQRAAELLRAGRLVALPTETVYGLAANALDAAAVRRIFAAKNRPAHNPLIVHAVGWAMVRQCVAEWPPVAAALAEAFWPGPLSLVLPRSAAIPDLVTAGGFTVAVRWPAHPLMRAVIEACGFPLAAPSANPSNRLSPTTARHVSDGLADRAPLIVDGGGCEVGIESTVVDVTGPAPRVLRPGMISAAAIAAVAHEAAPSPVTVPKGEALRSPGQLPRHYAPQAALEIWRWADEAELRARIDERGWDSGRVCVLAHERIPTAATGFLRVTVAPHDPAAYARALYAELHQCDADGAGAVIVEAPPEGAAWEAVRDRLRRASAPRSKPAFPNGPPSGFPPSCK